ncbi:MAG TPA: hypothetical protein VGH11_00725 [Jatrophihabitans sp.]
MPATDAYGLDLEQLGNAQTIVNEVKAEGLPARAAEIALMTADAESSLRNLHSGDRDSQGLFQQRPSQGWGSVAQVTDPVHATQSFLSRLKSVTGWQSQAPWLAAQAVQVSAYADGSNYQKDWASMAAEADALYGAGAGVQVPGGATSAPVSGGASIQTIGQITGGVQPASWSNLLPWNWGKDLSAAQAGLVQSVTSFTLKLAFIGGGVGLVLLGAYRAAAPAREAVGQKAEQQAGQVAQVAKVAAVAA